MSADNSRAVNPAPFDPQFLAAALARVGDAVIIIDAYSRIVYHNDAAASLYGVAPTTAVGRPLTYLHRHEWLHPLDEAAADAALAQYGFWQGQNYHVLPDGRKLHVESTVTALEQDGSRYLLAVIRDITAQERTAAALRNLEQWQRLALEAANLGTWVMDLPSQELFWDARCRQILDISPDEPANPEHGFGRLHPDDRPRVTAAITALARGELDHPYVDETRIFWSDGSLHWIAIRGRVYYDELDNRRPTRLAGVVLDITEHKLTEQALLATQERFRLALAKAPLFLAHCDRELRYTWLYNPHPDFAGIDYRGKTATDLADNPATQRYMEVKRQVIATGQRTRCELAFPLSDGCHTYDCTFDPLYDASGALVGLTTAALDITELKETQTALRELNATLEQRVAQRTAELERSNRDLDRFAYVASHDLKSPLRAIDNLALWIAEDTAAILPPEAEHNLARLRARIQRLEKMLDSLLYYSRAGRKHYAPQMVDTAALVASIVELLNPPAGCQIITEGPLPVLRSERLPLEIVLSNLLENAVKHHYRLHQAHIVISARTPEPGWVEFCVRDDGPGIEPQYHDRIFDVFQTLRPRDEIEGSGMGLAIVKKTVESFGGRIWLESTPGHGAAFCFTWPTTLPHAG